jgi:hypothetical protein
VLDEEGDDRSTTLRDIFLPQRFARDSVNGRIEFELSDIDTANIQRLGHGLAKLFCLLFRGRMSALHRPCLVKRT